MNAQELQDHFKVLNTLLRDEVAKPQNKNKGAQKKPGMPCPKCGSPSRVLRDEVAKLQNKNEEAQKMLGFLTLGIMVFESALLDLKRIADAQEALAINDAARFCGGR